MYLLCFSCRPSLSTALVDFLIYMVSIIRNSLVIYVAVSCILFYGICRQLWVKVTTVLEANTFALYSMPQTMNLPSPGKVVHSHQG